MRRFDAVFFENNMATVAQVKEASFFYCSTGDPLWNNVLPSSQRERRVSRLNRTGNNTTGWARRLTALLVTACLVMAMALPVYAEVDSLPDAPDEVELLEDEQETASGENTAPPEQNAATPEPEQSAEPEQPAPTETPEPTAEPTPTPEPAATATATPVPTVTPTATPEPTEQPQKMYAATSVDDVQVVSEPEVPATYKLYFAVPSGWSDCTRVIIYAVATNDTTKDPYTLEMQEDGKTGDGRKIYSADLNKDKHYPYGGLNGLEFHGYKGDTPVDEVVIADVNANPRTWWKTFDPNDKEHYIGGNYYDANAEGEKWSTYTVTVRHDDFAGKEMVFENKTSDETLTSVHAWFYEPDDKGELIQVGKPIASNSAGADSGIAPNSTATFTIPNELCSYVKFTWGEDNPQQSSKYYNFYGEDVSGDDKKSFTYNSDTRNCFIYTGVDNERWGIENSVLIYYDATFSKLPTTGKDDTSGDYSIPKDKQSTVYYRLKGENDNESINGTMSRIGSTDYYAADVPEGYTQIVFSSYPLSNDDNLAGRGDSTGWETIPDYKDKEPCFYADTNDDAVYGKGQRGNGQRGGYWAPKDTPRDAETWKKPETKVVDIDTAEFTEDPNTKYVTSTLYDYYTDYELNGKNRDNYKDNDNKASHRNWVTFREFDQALSDYYSNSGTTVPYPMYTGQFQPDAVGADGKEWGIRFSEIADKLNLYGYTDKKLFMAVNNSTSDRNGKGLGQNDEKLYDETFQGLAGPELKNGKPIMNGTTDLAMPFFNEEFLQGENSKKAKLGNVYKEVSFPFTQDEVFKESNADNANEKGVKYWYFDSDKTTLYLKNDPDNGGYFLQKQNALESKSKNLKSDSTPVEVKNEKGETVKNEKGEPVYTYGFFPFNSGASEKQASTYNYGFGAKLQFQFTLTSDGTVKDDNNNNIPIKFFFSGDDDVWVYIDGELALDVGGDHGKASGLLEFGADENGNNNYTSYVSDIKESNNTVYNPGAEKTVTYLGNKITFKYKSKQTTTLKPGTHTLTMYYMERGMWESNMAVAFNFPDNNELQVQKVVDLSNVTDQKFKECFEKQKIFNFTIQNQATHYGEKEAAKPNPSDTEKVILTAEGNKIEPATPGKKDDYIFELVKNPWPDSKPDSGQDPGQDPGQDTGQNTEKVLHWYARYMDTQSAAREKRRGILTLGKPINIKDMRFLTFQVYVSQKDGSDLSLNNLYLELLDNQTPTPGQKGSLGTTGINGATYGSVEVKTDQWVTVKLDLHKMKEQGDFNNNVTTIRVGDNYNRHIYFRNFTFIPKAVPSKMTGFTTDQEDIPDYGSAKSGNLENAENAQYTSNMDTDTQLVDEGGRFVLEAGETVTFSDQFRRGSYISLKEELNQSLYDTTWTVYENGQVVTSTYPDDTSNVTTVTFGEKKSLEKQKDPPKGPDDGRTEVYDDSVKNDGYKVSKKPEEANTIVFRSYKDPDETSSTLTKLKVKYVNTVKTGGLKIQKKAAAGEENTIKGTYTFKVTFNDVGGEGLEEKPIEKYVYINMSDGNNPDHTVTIPGIPVGTRYTIEEVKASDDSRLQSVTVPADCDSAHVINNNTMVEGVIKESNDPKVTAIFTNTRRKLINIEFDKHWIDAENKELKNQPSEIYIQLQRRLETQTHDDDWQAVEYAGSKYVMVPHTDGGWKRTFSGLDQYKINDDKIHTDYEYRIVEGTVTGTGGNSKFTQANGTITIKGNTYVVTAEAKAEISDGDSTKKTQAKVTADGTITGGSGKIELTNKLQNPKFVLDIIKKDAEKGENNNEVFLKDVEFKLEKLKAETTSGGEPQVDTTYEFDKENTGSITAKTNGNGEITKVFTDLKPGTYRLTETKAHPGYNLLAQPIKIKFTQDGKCYIDDVEVKKDDKTFIPGANNTYTLTLTVLNRKTPELPHTGADAPSLWLLIGMPLAVAGLLIFTFRYNRKGGRRH